MVDLAAASAVRVFRDERTAVLASLIGYVGDFQVAEDAVQDAFEAALAAWRRDGVPEKPAAWIMVTARRRAIDLLRRDRSIRWLIPRGLGAETQRGCPRSGCDDRSRHPRYRTLREDR
jgi:predicted RNA polymerase sigma factor